MKLDAQYLSPRIGHLLHSVAVDQHWSIIHVSIERFNMHGKLLFQITARMVEIFINFAMKMSDDGFLTAKWVLAVFRWKSEKRRVWFPKRALDGVKDIKPAPAGFEIGFVLLCARVSAWNEWHIATHCGRNKAMRGETRENKVFSPKQRRSD